MKKQLSRYSLKYRIAIIIFVLELVMMAAVLTVVLSHSLKTSQEHLTESENVIMELLGDLGRIALITSEYDELQPYIEQITSVPHVIDVFLANQSGRIVVSSDVTEIGNKLVARGGYSAKIWRQKNIVNATGKIGTLAIIFSHQDLIEANRDSLNLGIQIALSGMVFIALVGVAIGYLLTRRLESLAISAQRIAEGDLEVRTNLKGKDEVAIVGRAFDHMAENIKTYVDNLIDSEEELRRAHNTLEKRVEERTKQLAIATDEAVKANHSKSTFLANISHEIRTPLTAIIGFSGSLRDNTLNQVEYEEAVTTIHESGKHLLRIINDLLDLSKVEAKKIELEQIETSPMDIISEVKSLVQHQASQKGLYFNLEYSFPIPRTIISDPVRLKQILLNLCGNAVKFTSVGGVTLKASCHSVREEMIFKVIDTGIGLSDAHKEKIFNAFEQADSTTTRKYGGTGLGLSLSKSLAELLGGGITVSSTPEVGSCFTLMVSTGNLDQSAFIERLDDYQATAEKDKNYLAKSFSGNVLLAEDNKHNQKLVTLYLNSAGVKTSVANNGQEAVNLVQQNHFDLILMDINMPIMSGIEATRVLRAQGYTGPIAALTANAMRQDITRCLNAGCDTFLSKPIDLDKFFSILNTYLCENNNPDPVSQGGNITPIVSALATRNEGIFDALIKEFVDTLPETISKIHSAYEQEEWNRFSDEIHTLKGTGGNFGFEQITGICRHIEVSLRENRIAEIPEQLEELDILYTRILTGMETA